MTPADFEAECLACGRLLDRFGVCLSCGPLEPMERRPILPSVELGFLPTHVRLFLLGYSVGLMAGDLRALGNAALIAAEQLDGSHGARGADALWAGQEASRELDRAMTRFGPFASAHEGYAVLLEEVDELKAEVWKGRSRDYRAMHTEAVQVAAMALRFIADVTIPALRREEDGQA